MAKYYVEYERTIKGVFRIEAEDQDEADAMAGDVLFTHQEGDRAYHLDVRSDDYIVVEVQLPKEQAQL